MKILLLNGGKAFGHSKGQLNQTLHEYAREKLTAMGHEIQETIIDNGYDIAQEIAKFEWMDAVIWQMPGWWMGEPWTVKNTLMKYFRQAKANSLKVTDATVSPQQKATAQAVYCREKNICFH